MKLKIVPFEKIPQEVLEAIKEELKIAFRIFPEISSPIGLPKEFYNPYRHQYLAPQLLRFLEDEFKGRVLGVTREDLYTGDLNFIFGQAQLNGRVAIISICRLDPTFYKKDENKRLLIERAVKEAIHEVGHMVFGLTHCKNPECVMSFSNTIFDVDRKTKELCEKCRAKIRL